MTNHIAAVGLPVPDGSWRGRVHSVFKSSLNLKTESGQLLSVNRFDFGLLPGSYYCPEFSAGKIKPGDPVFGDDTHVRIGESLFAVTPKTLFVDTAIPALDPALIAPEMLELCRERLRRARPDDGDELTAELYRRLRRELLGLGPALCLGSAEAAQRSCEAMIGLGQGLTPSGDDMLLGVLAALRMFKPELHQRLAGAVKPLVGRTNDISACYLLNAVEGRAATPVTGALKALVTGELEAIETLLSVGHSSGADMLEGMLAAADIIAAQK